MVKEEVVHLGGCGIGNVALCPSFTPQIFGLHLTQATM